VRCYLMRKGQFATVEFLKPGTDESLIEQCKACFKNRSVEGFDGFEVWDRTRKIYVYPEPTNSN
jgi:hypothetical protein